MATIQLDGREFPLRFDLNLQEKVQERYGDERAITKKVFQYAEARWMLTELINEGLRYRKFYEGIPAEELTPQQVGMLVTFSDFSSGKISQAILDTVNESLGSDKKKLTMEDLEQAGLRLAKKTKE